MKTQFESKHSHELQQQSHSCCSQTHRSTVKCVALESPLLPLSFRMERMLGLCQQGKDQPRVMENTTLTEDSPQLEIMLQDKMR